MEGPKGKHLFGIVKVGERGQIVIPKEARIIFNIKAGDSVLIGGDEKAGLMIVTSDHFNLFPPEFSTMMADNTEDGK